MGCFSCATRHIRSEVRRWRTGWAFLFWNCSPPVTCVTRQRTQSRQPEGWGFPYYDGSYYLLSLCISVIYFYFLAFWLCFCECSWRQTGGGWHAAGGSGLESSLDHGSGDSAWVCVGHAQPGELSEQDIIYYVSNVETTHKKHRHSDTSACHTRDGHCKQKWCSIFTHSQRASASLSNKLF